MALEMQVKDGKIVDASAAASSQSQVKERHANNSLGQQDFLELLVAEMQYQDPLEPQSNTEYIAQLATFTQVQEIEEMQGVVQNMQGNNLIGKYVILETVSKATGASSYVSGIVDYVTYENGKTYLSVNDSLYSLDDLNTVTTPEYTEAVTMASNFADMMNALPKVEELTLMDEAKLTKARTYYDSMTKDQQKYVSAELVNKLTELEAQMKKLKGDTEETTASDTADETGTTDESSTIDETTTA